MATARIMARRTSRPGALIAARRLADDPRAAFRAVSGLVLALFITTVAVVAITTQDAKNLTRWGSAAEAAVVTDQLADQALGSASYGEGATTGAGPAAPVAPLAAQLQGIHGVQGVVAVRADPKLTIPGTFPGLGGSPVPAGVVSCAQLAAVPALGRCPAGATTAAFPEDGFDGPLFGVDATGITCQPRTSRPRGWTASQWTPSTWRRTAPRRRSNRSERCLRTHTRIPPSTGRPPSAT